MAETAAAPPNNSVNLPTPSLEGEDVVTNLQCQLKSLQIRIKELEQQNAALSSQLSNCRCQKLVESFDLSIVSGNGLVKESRKAVTGDEKSKEAQRDKENGTVNENENKKSKAISPGCNLKILSHHAKRYVALKIMYFGQRFHGFAAVQADPTIESEIFKALENTRLLVADRKDSQYTRCGRTDKGVSSVGQVISLYLRSKSKDGSLDANYKDSAPENIRGEIDYVKVLNKALPKDIRVVGWSPAPIDFHARFSCLSREYKYMFWRENLDISAMEIAGKKFSGEHDFRNFCKMDVMHVHNFRRNITSFEISICSERDEGDQLWAITVKGSAFLWHQIRCMVAVLFMIGQGLESPSVIDDLLDTNRIPRKPQYCMAPELPLVLRSCEFEGLKFTISPDARKALQEHFKNEIRIYKLQATIFQEALLSCLCTTNGEWPLNHDKKVAHIPLMSRPTEPTYEERWAKVKAKA